MRFVILFAAILAFVPPAVAQQDLPRLPTFDSRDDMRAELDRLMTDLDFAAVVERFSPPALMSLGRVQVLEQRIKQSFDQFDGSAHLMLEEQGPDATREVIAYWVGDLYAYVYLLTHLRDDGVKVLDFRITGDVRAIRDWW